MNLHKMQIVREGDDYQPQMISRWRLRELIQHEKDNASLRLQIAVLQQEIDHLKAEAEARG